MSLVKLKVKKIYQYINKHRYKKVLVIVGCLVILIILAQFIYPSDRLVPFTNIEGVNLGLWKKDDAIKKLDELYDEKKISIFFSQSNDEYMSPTFSDIGLKVANTTRINTIDYPWYLRLIPTSIFWEFLLQNVSTPTYAKDEIVLSNYIKEKFGNVCSLAPVDASLKSKGADFEVVSSQDGEACDLVVVNNLLSSVSANLNKTIRVDIPTTNITPTIVDSDAKAFGDSLKEKVGEGLQLSVNGSIKTVSAADLFSWFDFSSADGKLTYVINKNRATEYFNKEIAPSVAKAAGTSKVSTYDFAVVSRIDGQSGKQLDIDGTITNIKSYIDGASSKAVAAIKLIYPAVVYSRSYSATDTGLSALMQQYAESHEGIFGISLVELSGQTRRASYNETKVFTTASTYKLFVAYSTLKRVEAGTWNWSDQIVDGKNLTTCFNDMIVNSDNDCGAALLIKAGHRNVTNDAHELGCNSTSFTTGDSIITTPADLALFLAELQSGQMLNLQSSRDVFIDALKRNVYRQGIPAGLSGIAVADKSGFLDGLLHDAAIIYSPTGTYVLVIMTDGSNWSSIANLASQIEALRNQ